MKFLLQAFLLFLHDPMLTTYCIPWKMQISHTLKEKRVIKQCPWGTSFGKWCLFWLKGHYFGALGHQNKVVPPVKRAPFSKTVPLFSQDGALSTKRAIFWCHNKKKGRKWYPSNLFYQGNCWFISFSSLKPVDKSMACLTINWACYFQLYSSVITWKLCDCVKTRCFIVFLWECDIC